MTDETPEEKLSSEPSADGVKQPLTSLRIFLRGLAVSLPAILTVVIVIWIIQFINDKLIEPATWTVKYVVATFVDESVAIRTSGLRHIDAAPPLEHCGNNYLVTPALRDEYFQYLTKLKTEQPVIDPASEAPPDWNLRQRMRADWMQREADETAPYRVYVPLGPRAVPYPVYATVARSLPPGQVPSSAAAVYRAYVAERKLWSVMPLSVITVAAVLFLLYFMGRFVSIRIGRWIVVKFEEQVLGRLPVVRNVYGSVKQVTDFVFTENYPVEYRRVVACEYPRKGIWSIGFVTGESMLDIAVAEGEPCLSVLIPTSPMPMTGFTVSVPKSSVVDLNLTVEQAMQFCISCGVLTPQHQRLTREIHQRMIRTGAMRDTAIGQGGGLPARPASELATFPGGHAGEQR